MRDVYLLIGNTELFFLICTIKDSRLHSIVGLFHDGDSSIGSCWSDSPIPMAGVLREKYVTPFCHWLRVLSYIQGT